jgi:RNA polymerase sigma-70 factor (ECF subfamily)
MSYTTHATLLARVAEGVDPAAWTEFHRRYGELIRGFARRRGLQPADCDDVAQDVLLALSKSMGDFAYDPDKGKFRSYLKTIVVRAVYRKMRQKRGVRSLGEMEVEESGSASDSASEEVWEEQWRQYHVRQAMQRLEAEFNEHDRMAFSQNAMRGIPAAEVAESLGLSVDQVYQAKSRILKRLSALIAEQIEDEG